MSLDVSGTWIKLEVSPPGSNPQISPRMGLQDMSGLG